MCLAKREVLEAWKRRESRLGGKWGVLILDAVRIAARARTRVWGEFKFKLGE